jgi:hypothetical protein
MSSRSIGRFSSSFQWTLLILACAILLAASQTANACSCGPQATVLNAFDGADEVVIARPISVERAQDGNDQSRFDGVISTTMVVEKVFKGNLKVRDEIV